MDRQSFFCSNTGVGNLWFTNYEAFSEYLTFFSDYILFSESYWSKSEKKVFATHEREGDPIK